MDFSASAITEAIALLPAWVRWLPGLVDLVLAWLLAWILIRLALLAAGPVSAVSEQHWTERARLAWNRRIAPQVAGMAVAAGFLVRSYTREHAVDAWPDWLHRVLIVVIVEAVRIRMGWRIERALRGDWLTWSRTWRSALAMRLIYFAPMYFALLFILSVPGGAGPEAWTIAGIGAALVLATARGYGISLAVRLGIMKPADERLAAVVAASAERTGIRRPKAWIFPAVMPNAFAFTALHEIAFTDRALEVLDDGELGAIADHEMGHLDEPRAVRFGRSFAVAPVAVLVFIRPLYDRFGLGSALIILGVSIILLSVIGRLIRPMEARADEAAHGHDHGEDEGRYAGALEHLHQDGLLPAVMPGKHPSHPHLYDRMKSAGVEPAFPRPAPPSGKRRGLMTLVVLGVFLPVMIGLAYADAGSLMVERNVPRLNLWSLGAVGPEESTFGYVAGDLWSAGRQDAAAVFYRAAGACDGRSVWPPACLARLEAERGRREAARRALDEAERRLEARGGITALHPSTREELEAARDAVGK